MRMNSISPNENSGSLFEIANSWLSTNDVAKILSVTPNAVRILVCRGRLPAFRLGRHLRFRKKDCMALVQKTGA
jgi:excisionase family DNA binding protein